MDTRSAEKNFAQAIQGLHPFVVGHLMAHPISQPGDSDEVLDAKKAYRSVIATHCREEDRAFVEAMGCTPEQQAEKNSGYC